MRNAEIKEWGKGWHSVFGARVGLQISSKLRRDTRPRLKMRDVEIKEWGKNRHSVFGSRLTAGTEGGKINRSPYRRAGGQAYIIAETGGDKPPPLRTNLSPESSGGVYPRPLLGAVNRNRSDSVMLFRVKGERLKEKDYLQRLPA